MDPYPWSGFNSNQFDGGGDLTQEALAGRKLSVDVYHLNVGLGECAVYFLVEHPYDSVRYPSWVRPYIHRAVLIDGGFQPAKDELHPAQKFMQQNAPAMYQFPKTQGGRVMGSPAFDSMVITHWDSDHYEGVLWLLVEDLYSRNPPSTNGRDAFLKSYKNPLLKYNDNTNDNANRAKSVLYVPYWNKRGVAKFPSKGSANKDRVFYKDDNGSIFFSANKDSWTQAVGVNQQYWTQDMCKLRSDLKDVLAVNLFTNVIPSTKDFTSPRELAIAHTVNQDTAIANPCLVVVSVAGTCTGSSTAADSVWPTRFNQIYESRWFKDQNQDPEIWTEARSYSSQAYPDGSIEETLAPANQLSGMAPGNTGPDLQLQAASFSVNMIDDPLPQTNEAKVTNANSIITMVIWGDGHISHYSAGDANWENELKVVWWVWNSNNPYKTVRAVKLSHHGSADSTPVELIRGFRPRSIIVSAFDEYGHPRWEVLLWLYFWRAATNAARTPSASADRSNGFLYPTCYPYYLATELLADKTMREAWRGTHISIKAFSTTANTKQNSKYTESLQKLNKRTPSSPDVLKKFQRLELDSIQRDKDSYKAFLYEQTRQAFEGMSDLRDTAVPRANSVIDGHMLNMTDEKQVQFVKVCCRSWDTARNSNADGNLDGVTNFSTFELTPAQVKGRKASNEKKAARIAKSALEVQLEELERRFTLVNQLALNLFTTKDYPRAAALRSLQNKRQEIDQMYRKKTKGKSFLLEARLQGHPELDDCDLGAVLVKKNRHSVDEYHQTMVDKPNDNMFTFFIGKFKKLNPFTKKKAKHWSSSEVGQDSDESDGGLMTMSIDSGPDPRREPVNDKAAPTSTSETNILTFLESLGNSQPKAATTLSTLEGGWQAVSIAYDGGVAVAAASPSRILASSRFDDFLISLTSSPIRFDVPNAKVSEDDDLFKFFQTTLQASEVNLDFDLSTTDTKSAAFNGLRVAIPEPVAIEYSSQNLVSASHNNFNMSDYPSFQVPGPAYFFDDCSILLGVTSDSVKSPWTLENVLVVLGLVPSDAGNLLQALRESIGAQGGQFTLAAGAVWFTPGQPRTVRNRLEWHLGDADVASIQNFVHRYLPKLNVVECKIVGRTETQWSDSIENIDLTTSREMTLVLGAKYNDKLSFGAIIDIRYGGDNGIMTLTISPPAVTIEDIIVWVIGLFDPEGSNVSEKDKSGILAFVNAIPIIGSFSDRIILRRLKIDMSHSSMDRLTLYFEINPGWKAKTGKAIPFLVMYRYTPSFPQAHEMTAQPWLTFPGQLSSKTPRPLLFDYDDFRIMKPSIDVSDGLDLSSIMPGDWIRSLPQGLDLAIVDARIVLSGTRVSLYGRLMSQPRDEEGGGEKIKDLGLSLDEVALAASFEWGAPGNDGRTLDSSSYRVELGINLDLTPDYGDDVEVEPINLRGSIQYQSANDEKYFSLSTSIEDLTLRAVLNFFPTEDAAVIADTLSDFEIKCFDMHYDFDSGGGGKNFLITAIILLGPIELDLVFHRNQLTWNFTAKLRPESGSDITLENLLRSLLGDSDVSKAIPDFIRDINLGGIELAASDEAPDDTFEAAVSLTLESKDVAVGTGNMSAESPKNSFFIMSLSMAVPLAKNSGIEFSYLQVSNKTVLKGAGKPDVDVHVFTKRVVRATIGQLPWGSVPKVPLLSNLDPPFDELDFLWASSDLTRSDISVIGETGGLRYKDIAPTHAATDVLLQAGWHFILSPKSIGAVAILDYAFAKNSETEPSSAHDKPGDSSATNPAPAPKPQGEVDESGGTKMAPLDKTVGPLKISNIGLRFENGEIVFYLDAMVKLGPIGFLLKGFGMGVSIEGTFADIVDTAPTLRIQGIGVEFNCAPVALAGMFLNMSTGNDVVYMGGLALDLQPYSLMAVGSYSEIAAQKSGQPYKSVFVYARLDGPLVELGWMTISGVMIGLGYNSVIRQPSVSEVTQFPFLMSPTTANESPLDVMNQYSGPDSSTAWIKPQAGSLWMAAGVNIKAFQMLEAEAVLMVQLGASVSVNAVALCRAQMPPRVDKNLAFLYVELGITASFDPQIGALRVEGQLTPNSFVINPSCHLTGNFALCSWFESSPYSGDFVFSVGGYHPAYKPPSHYPIPHRVGISWDVGGGLMITGNAYFAITPKCCMGGGMLKAVFSLGHLYAYFTVYADFLIDFAPFFFQGQIGVSVGVRYVQSLWFTTITVSGDIGADLRLRGPPFGGTAHVNFWIFGFDVEFGDGSSRVTALSFQEFRALILNCPEEKVIDYKSDDDPTRPPIDDDHTLTIETGRRVLPNAKAATESAGELWHVNLGGFRFRIESKIPVQTVNGQDFGQTHAFFAKPMQRTEQLGSSLVVKVEAIERKPDNSVYKEEKAMSSGPITKRMPTSLWGKYDSDSDPGRTSDTGKLNGLLSPKPGTDIMDCLIGATFSNPPAQSPTEAIKPFDPRVSMKQSVFDGDDHIVPIVPPNTVFEHADWLAAEPPQVPLENRVLLWKTLREAWTKPKLASVITTPLLESQSLSAVPPTKATASPGVVAHDIPNPADTVDNSSTINQDKVETKGEDDREDRAQQLLTGSIIDAWSDAFSWETSADVGTKLKNERPTMLLDQLEQLYMSCPLIA